MSVLGVWLRFSSEKPKMDMTTYPDLDRLSQRRNNHNRQSLCDRTSAANEFAVGPERMTSEREGGSEGLERGGKNGGEGGRD